MKTNTLKLATLWLLLWFVPVLGYAAPNKEALTAQKDYEREIDAIVRHKYFYKSKRVEWDLTAGGLPYESLVDTITVGGRVTWHITDHVGWEILDFQKGFTGVSAYTTDLVSKKGLSRLETYQMNMTVGTSLLLSPLYGKIRFIGRQVLYFDIYMALGFGGAYGDSIGLTTAGQDKPADPPSLVARQWNPMVDFGFGFKVFLNNAVGLVIDFRDYMVSVPLYDSTRLKHQFAAQAGVVIFTPFF